jgi:hypothetical protein
MMGRAAISAQYIGAPRGLRAGKIRASARFRRRLDRGRGTGPAGDREREAAACFVLEFLLYFMP